jgi:hypothetical protein
MECCSVLPADRSNENLATDERNSLQSFMFGSSRGGNRTRTPNYGHGILNPERLPFRHSAVFPRSAFSNQLSAFQRRIADC